MISAAWLMYSDRFCAVSVIGYAAQTRWAITQNANVHIQVAQSLGQALAQYKSQNPQQPMLYAPAPAREIADIRRVCGAV